MFTLPKKTDVEVSTSYSKAGLELMEAAEQLLCEWQPKVIPSLLVINLFKISLNGVQPADNCLIPVDYLPVLTCKKASVVAAFVNCRLGFYNIWAL